MEEPDKILVRSNGTVTYTAKDIAYQLWKFGLLDVDFEYELFRPEWNTGAVTEEEISREIRERPLWRTARDGQGVPGAPDFGKATAVINVIDVRQAYLQKVVKEGLRVLGYASEAERSVHFSYETVALTPRAARELAERFQEEYRLSPEDEKKPFVEMSGRKGLGVKIDDLVDLLLERSRKEIALRRKEQDAAAETDARAIAVGALRYFLLKFGRNKVIAFDFDDALNFEGDTGPYLQYSLVRADNIFRKLEERGLAVAPAVRAGRVRRLGRRPLERRARCGRDPRGRRARRVLARAFDGRPPRLRARPGFQPLLPPAADRERSGPGGPRATHRRRPDLPRRHVAAARAARDSRARKDVEMLVRKVNLAEKFGGFREHWSPKIAGEVNDSYVKLVKFQGEFVWHKHDDEDEMFLVVSGRIKIRFRDGDVDLEENEFVVVPKGVEHCPVADEGGAGPPLRAEDDPEHGRRPQRADAREAGPDLGATGERCRTPSGQRPGRLLRRPDVHRLRHVPAGRTGGLRGRRRALVRRRASRRARRRESAH